ncbi:hypothetical protein [Nocardia neocaledoniensis]|uniref:hypothetical protein n=1 Tax=Nocardia neocaledoniensis TaxID=236511 RepID=UPI0024576248|nr:hypothetical protein [Nocardia neocaledoniensis]
MPVPQIDPSEWKRLESQAAAGSLRINPDVGRSLAQVCDTHLDNLEKLLADVSYIEKVTGFGTFNSSAILEKKFSLTAVGGDRSLDETLRKHVEAVTAAKAAVLQAIANFEAQDTYNAGQFDGLGGN